MARVEAALPSYGDGAGAKGGDAGAPVPEPAAGGPMQLGLIDRSMTRPRRQGSVALSAESLLLRRVHVSAD